MIVAIHQPQYLPWIPYCDKADQADIFVFLDNVQFQKNGVQNRNQIKTPSGAAWLTIPVRASLERTIAETELADPRWCERHIRTIEMNYARAPHFQLVRTGLAPILRREWTCLADLNIAVTEWLFGILGIQTKLLRASELGVKGKAEELVIGICRELGADVYLSGQGARAYQQEDSFARNGIALRYHECEAREYPQCHPKLGFVPNLSALDLILNVGPESRQIMEGGRHLGTGVGPEHRLQIPKTTSLAVHCEDLPQKEPMISRKIAHSAPTLGQAEALALQTVIQSGFVGFGPAAGEVERRISEITGKSYAFAVSSGFHALSLAIMALDLAPQSIISLPVLTCASVLAAVRHSGHHAWLADVSDPSLVIDLHSISSNSAALIVPRAYGAPLNSSKIAQLGLPWIEDCATSPASVSDEDRPGRAGDLAVFSFASTKYITGGAGGVVATDSGVLAERILDLLEYDRAQKRGNWCHLPPPPFPGRMPDVNAVLALCQMNQMADFARRRRAIAQIYCQKLSSCDLLQLPDISSPHSFYRFLVYTSIPSQAFWVALQAQNIDARASVNPWLDRWITHGGDVGGGPWPVAHKWRDHVLSLPIYPQMSDEDAERTANCVLAVAERESHGESERRITDG